MKTTGLPLWQGFAFALAISVSTQALAFEEGDWLVRFGASTVAPKSDNSPIVEVDDGTSLTFNFTYFMTANWGLEVLAAWPFEHDIDLIGGGKVADTEHLPPTVSMNYHFMPDAGFQPYLGVGLNYTTFFSTDTTGALEGTNLSLDDSWGLAYQLGADIPINDKWIFNLNVRYIDIETDATLDGVDIGTVEIDPWVYGLHVGFKF